MTREGYVRGVRDVQFLRSRRFHHQWTLHTSTELLSRMLLAQLSSDNSRWIFQHWISDVIYEIDWRV